MLRYGSFFLCSDLNIIISKLMYRNNNNKKKDKNFVILQLKMRAKHIVNNNSNIY